MKTWKFQVRVGSTFTFVMQSAMYLSEAEALVKQLYGADNYMAYCGEV